jgi:hypothetical protein
MRRVIEWFAIVSSGLVSASAAQFNVIMCAEAGKNGVRMGVAIPEMEGGHGGNAQR